MEWIKFVDDQPEKNGEYLVCDSDETLWLSFYEDGDWSSESGMSEVVYWMDFPEPPCCDDEDEEDCSAIHDLDVRLCDIEQKVRQLELRSKCRT